MYGVGRYAPMSVIVLFSDQFFAKEHLPYAPGRDRQDPGRLRDGVVITLGHAGYPTP